MMYHLRWDSWWDFSVKGRRKIQDLWGSVVYKVLRAPDEGRLVYTIAPADDPTKVNVSSSSKTDHKGNCRSAL